MKNKRFKKVNSGKLFNSSAWSRMLKQIPVGVRTGAVLLVAGLVIGAYYVGKNTALAEEAAAPAINVTSAAEKSASLEGTKIRRSNNKWQFSSDDGATWSETPPEGIYEGKDGRLYYESEKIKGMNNEAAGEIAEFPFGDGAGNGVIMKRENDTWQFSSDGGKTWSDPLQDIEDWIENGFTMTVAEGILMKLQDDKVVYSTDGGETWTEEVPEGLEVPENSVIAKGEDGKMKYSTDGGKTWSEEKPEGFEIPTVEDILDSLPEGLIPSLDGTEESDDLDASATSI